MACTASSAANVEKQAGKQLQTRAKAMVKDAKALERSERLVEARKEYVQSEAVFETKDAVKGIKRVDDKLQQQVKMKLAEAQKIYAGGQYRQAADRLEGALLLETFTAAVQRDLALCYYRLGDSAKAVVLLDQAATGTPDPIV
jgi:Flp pilus assembly protein TadD